MTIYIGAAYMMKYEEYDSAIINQGNVVCYIIDRDTYDLIHVTKKGMELFGLQTPEDYYGKKCYQILQGRTTPCPHCNNALLKIGETHSRDHFNEYLQRWMYVEDSLIDLDGQQYRIEYARDVCAEQKKNRRLSDQRSIEKVLLDCVRALSIEDDYDQAFNRFLERLGRYYRASRAAIFEFDLKNKLLYNTYEWCAPIASPLIDHLQGIPLSHIQNWIEKFQKYNEFCIHTSDEELSHDSAEFQFMDSQNIKNILAAPLYANNQLIGFIAVDDPTNRKDDLTLLRATTSFVTEEQKKYRLIKDLDHANNTDHLTGLRNRSKYTEVLRRYETCPPQSLGIIYADVNGLKAANDTYGHKYGDQVLTMVSRILKQFDHDNTYRIGGDEFIVLLENIEQEAFNTFLVKMKQQFEDQPGCDVSLGCLWTHGETDIYAQIAQASELMYAQKQSYYQNVLHKGTSSVTGIYNEVAKEIAQNRFVVFFQPQIDIHTGEVIGAEALVRKKNADGTIITPDKFIPYYEIGGVIRHVDLFVFETVCAALREWETRDIHLKIAVNFSRVTLMEPNIVDTIVSLCEKYDVSPHSITIEVTESISKITHEQLCQLFNDLADRGFSLALDDFGSKYSNLSILNDLSFHVIKLDKTLVDQLHDNTRSQTIMKNIIRMCKEIRVSHILAEGIETKEQLDFLSQYECEYGQGYFFSRPVALDQFNRFIEEHNHIS